MKIKDTTARKIFKALGFQTADKWDIGRLQTKINKLPDLIVDDVEIGNEKLMDVVDKIITTIENGKEVIVAKKKKEKEKDVKTNKKTGKKSKVDRATGKKTKTVDKISKDKKVSKKSKVSKDKKTTKTTKTVDKAAKKSKTTTKKIGICDTVIEVLSKGKAVSKEHILKVLVKRFPDRAEESMKRTVSMLVPSKLRSLKNIEVVKDKKGKYLIKD